MQRIVNGHYADNESTRNIIGISFNDWELLSAELLVSKKLSQASSDMDFKEKTETLFELLDSLENPELFLPEGVTIETLKESFNDPNFEKHLNELNSEKIKVINSLSSKAKLINNTWSVIGITPSEYYYFIECLVTNFNSYLAAANNKTNLEAQKLANLLSMNAESDSIFEDHPFMQDIPEGKTFREAKIEMAEKMIPIMNKWLEVLNQPYEGAIYN